MEKKEFTIIGYVNVVFTIQLECESEKEARKKIDDMFLSELLGAASDIESDTNIVEILSEEENK